MGLQELREERARVATEAKSIMEEADGALDDETDQKVDTLLERFDQLTERVQKAEDREAKFDEIEEELGRREERIARVTGREPESIEDFDERHNRVFRKFVTGQRFDEEDRSFLNSDEYRALAVQTVGTSGQGGVTVPTDFRAELVESLKAFGGMRRSRATVITTNDGRNLTVPTEDDTGNLATIVGEATAITNSTHVPFASVTLEAVKYKSGPIKLSRELMQDSALDIEGIVRRKMAARFGRATEAHYATRSSTESSGPHGIINASTGSEKLNSAAFSSTNTTGVIDAFVGLIHDVDPAYRVNAEFMFNDDTLSRLRKLKDGNNNLIWSPGFAAGVQDRVLGFPYIVNNEFNGSTSGAKYVAFGDLSHFWIRDVQAIDVIRLDERYAEEDVVALLAFMRTDARPVIGNTVSGEEPIQFMFSTA